MQLLSMSPGLTGGIIAIVVVAVLLIIILIAMFEIGRAHV